MNVIYILDLAISSLSVLTKGANPAWRGLAKELVMPYDA